MLHAKFQDHRTSGSGEEDFLRFSAYMGMAAILVMCSGPFIYFRSPFPRYTCLGFVKMHGCHGNL